MSIAAAPDPARPESADTFAWVSPAHDRRQLAPPREPEIAIRDRKFVARLRSRRIYALPYRRSIGQVSGFRSKTAMAWSAATEVVLGEQHRPAANVAVPVRVRQLVRRAGRVVRRWVPVSTALRRAGGVLRPVAVPGDQVTFIGNPTKTGVKSMWITRIILPNGEDAGQLHNTY